jgi:hypothetical protein
VIEFGLFRHCVGASPMREGVVQSIVESRYSHTLDKYIVRLEATDLEIEVFDVELRKIHE